MIEKKIFYLLDGLNVSNKENRTAKRNYLKQESPGSNKQNLTKIFHKFSK